MNKMLVTILTLSCGSLFANCINIAGVYKNISCDFHNPSGYTSDDLSVTMQGIVDSNEGVQIIQNDSEIGLSDISQIPGRYTPHNTIFLSDKDISDYNLELKMNDFECQENMLNSSYQLSEFYGSPINNVTTRYKVEVERFNQSELILSVNTRLKLLFTAGIFVEGSSLRCVLRK
jgi:hypothetical protein